MTNSGRIQPGQPPRTARTPPIATRQYTVPPGRSHRRPHRRHPVATAPPRARRSEENTPNPRREFRLRSASEKNPGRYRRTEVRVNDLSHHIDGFSDRSRQDGRVVGHRTVGAVGGGFPMGNRPGGTTSEGHHIGAGRRRHRGFASVPGTGLRPQTRCGSRRRDMVFARAEQNAAADSDSRCPSHRRVLLHPGIGELHRERGPACARRPAPAGRAAPMRTAAAGLLSAACRAGDPRRRRGTPARWATGHALRRRTPRPPQATR
ncbi:hypothetical protein UA75_25055 [Actinoalloteichus sp. GBA129-24]|uniref:Uncharacterized protein n=1 Tax=Actinoalloteichus fjordicus TaxID=1612552 RepID=A0AAC9PTP8_9PSEU|nr:hypothetical protein UA74_24475 [Actinoalloteichus fjordicus]APU22989.1 hypothetical protein UA75_25055 [Actinoalloteichus sp. GBA129-24]